MELSKFIDLASMTQCELEDFILGIEEKRFRAVQIYKEIHQKHKKSICNVNGISKNLKEKLNKISLIGKISLLKTFESKDGAIKYKFKTSDGCIIESVFIPNSSAKGKNTACLSSQIGCAMGCKFCATSKIKFRRHLFTSEIVSQIYEILAHIEGKKIHNIVYMGTGEPLHNYYNVGKSILILRSKNGINYSKRKITISTSGMVPKIKWLSEQLDVRLAVSLNATTNEKRSSLMPINKKWNIEDLIKACKEFPSSRHRQITFEYVIIKDINDTDSDAKNLIEITKNINCKINLIPFNPHPGSNFERPSAERIKNFQSMLRFKNKKIFIRNGRGEDICGACGTLGLD